MADDARYIETLFGFYPNDWDINWGDFAEHHYLLDREYIDEGCDTLDYSSATHVLKFIYPHFFKNVYFIEGVIKGQITLAADENDATVTAYRVTLCSMKNDLTDVELESTGWKTQNDVLDWDEIYEIGEERVYPFWIDCWQYKTISGKERLYLKIEVQCSNSTILLHTNGGEFIDLKVEIPIKG